ncbi:hypothetical protein L195_g041429, partial [Trifolium pratense]
MATEDAICNNTVGATEKPFKFEGLHFKRWQQKMYFFLTLKKVVNVLKERVYASLGVLQLKDNLQQLIKHI